MSAEYSVDEVRARFEAWAKPTYGIGRHPGLPDQYAATGVQCAWAAWQVAYASRIEADERAVPVGHFCEMSSGQWEQTRHEFAGLLGVTPLFTHPPAQAAQVDGLVSRNPAPNAAAPMMPSPDVTLHVGAPTHPHSPDAADSGRVDANCMDVLRRLRDMLPTVGICGWPAGVSALDEAISTLAAQGQGEPVAKVRHFDYRGIARNGFSQEAQMLDGAPVLPDGTPLYTRPATAASPAGVPDLVRFAIERCLRSQEALVDNIDKANPDDPYASLLVADDIEYLRAWLAAPSAPEGGEVQP